MSAGRSMFCIRWPTLYELERAKCERRTAPARRHLHRRADELPTHRDECPRAALGVPAEADVGGQRVLVAEEALDRIAIVDAVGAGQGVQRVDGFGALLDRPRGVALEA